MSTDLATTRSASRSKRGSTTLAKAAQLLRTVAKHFPTGGTLSRIAREAGMNTATTHRLLTALTEEGLLTFDPYAKTYHVGFELLEIAESAQAVAPDLRLRHRLRPLLARIALRTEEWVYLYIRSSLDSICIDCVEGSYPLSTNTLAAGARRPLGISAGSIALLAALPLDEADRLIRENQHRFERYSGVTAGEVEEAVVSCRREGFALSDGRLVPEVAAIAVAFRMPGTREFFSISVASLRARMDEARRRTVVATIREEIKQLDVMGIE